MSLPLQSRTARVDFQFVLTMAPYNLVRMRSLLSSGTPLIPYPLNSPFIQLPYAVSHMAVFKYRVALEKKEVRMLEAIINKGTSPPRTVTRARVLLLANENRPHKTNKEIYEVLMLAKTTSKDIRKRYSERGLDKSLHDAPRPGQPPKWSGTVKAKITAIACTQPKDGYSRWTLHLLREEVKEKLNKTVGRTTFYKVLLANEVKPWRDKTNVVHWGNYA